GVDFHRNLGDIIALNTEVPRDELGGDVFFTDGEVPPESCIVSYVVKNRQTGAYEGTMQITNTGSWALDSWALRWTVPDGYQRTEMRHGKLEQEGSRVTVTNDDTYDGSDTVTLTYVGTGGDAGHATPVNLSLNTTPCVV